MTHCPVLTPPRLAWPSSSADRLKVVGQPETGHFDPESKAEIKVLVPTLILS